MVQHHYSWHWKGCPSNAPCNDVAPLKTITYRAIKTTGTLIVYFERGKHVGTLGFPKNFHFFQQTVFHLLPRGDRYLGWLGGGIVNKYHTELVLLVENEPRARLKAGLSHLPCLYTFI